MEEEIGLNASVEEVKSFMQSKLYIDFKNFCNDREQSLLDTLADESDMKDIYRAQGGLQNLRDMKNVFNLFLEDLKNAE